MKKRGKKKRKKKSSNNKKIIFGVVLLALIILVIIIFSNNSEDFVWDDKETDEIILKYNTYSIPNEEFLKENCYIINVGRCDVIGEEFGESCWMREVDLFFDVEGSSYKDITCRANEKDKYLGEYKFQIKDGLKYLPVKVDIRKYNQVKICCEVIGESEQICLNPIEINNVC